ncbi:hypothetical protein GQ600_12425 [Phytophthora cactorum]|nr:hypothetical protein GQ600_12425 [Phytophthora cactorum]
MISTLHKYFKDDRLLAMMETAKRERKLSPPRWKMICFRIDAYNSRYQEKKTTMIEMLTRKFNDVRVATALTAAKIASKLESAQLEMSKSHGESIDDVYEMLNLYA